MKTYLTLTLMMISTFAWAMPFAKYIPADAVKVDTLYMPPESAFVKGFNAFSDSVYSLTTFSPIDLVSYGITSGTVENVLDVSVPPSKDDLLTMRIVFLEGTFDVDMELAKIRQLGVYACGKVPSGGIYYCSKPMDVRVQALLSGEEKAISPTSAFAKMANEKNAPNRLAKRSLIAEGMLQTWTPFKGILACKVTIVERISGEVEVDMVLYGKTTSSIVQFDAQVQGTKMMLDPFTKGNPAFGHLVNQIKTTADLEKKRFSLSAIVNVKDLDVIKDVVSKNLVMHKGSSSFVEDDDTEDSLLTTSPTFTIEKLEDFVGKDQSKILTLEGHAITVRATDASYVRVIDEAKSPAVQWEIATPMNLKIQEVIVTQGDKSFPVLFVEQDAFSMLDSPYVRKTLCPMDAFPTGDVEIAFRYENNPLIKISPALQIEKVKDFASHPDQSKTITLEDGVTATLRAETFLRDYILVENGVETPIEGTGIRWKFTLPRKVEIKDVYIAHGEMRFGSSFDSSQGRRDAVKRDVFASRYDDQDIQNLVWDMDYDATEDIQMKLEYRIREGDERSVMDTDLKTSPIFTIEKLEDLVDNKGQSKTFVIDDRTVTLRAETAFYPSVDLRGIETKEPSTELKLFHPADLDIETMYVMQGTKRLHDRRALKNKRTHGDKDAQDESSCNIFGKVTGDIQVVFEYRIEPID